MHGGSELTMDPECGAPEGDTESGEQPEERPNRFAMETGLERPNVMPTKTGQTVQREHVAFGTALACKRDGNTYCNSSSSTCSSHSDAGPSEAGSPALWVLEVSSLAHAAIV